MGCIFALFLPSHIASQLSFIKEQDVLMSDWEYVRGLDITLFLPSHVTSIHLRTGCFIVGLGIYPRVGYHYIISTQSCCLNFPPSFH
jgi:hypothetical protein